MNNMPPSQTTKNSLSFLNFFHLAFTVIAVFLLAASAGIIGFKVAQDAIGMTRPMLADECEKGSPQSDCIMTVTGVVTSVQQSANGEGTQESITVAVMPEDQENERRFVNGFLNITFMQESGVQKEDTVQAVAMDRNVYFLITESDDYIYGTDFSGVDVSVGLYTVTVAAASGALMGLGYALRRAREHGWRKVGARRLVSASSRSFAFGWSVLMFTVLSSGAAMIAFETDLISPDMALPWAMIGTLAGALCSLIAIRWQRGHDVVSEPEPERDTAPTLGSRLREQL